MDRFHFQRESMKSFDQLPSEISENYKNNHSKYQEVELMHKTNKNKNKHVFKKIY